jgi:hypothetical protein
MALDRARQFLMDQIGDIDTSLISDNSPPRLTLNALEKISMSRSRERILSNLDEMYREAFERAKETGDESRSCSTCATRSKSGSSLYAFPVVFSPRGQITDASTAAPSTPRMIASDRMMSISNQFSPSIFTPTKVRISARAYLSR